MKTKKGALSILLLILLIIPNIIAIDITLSKDTYSPLETLQAEITGNFVTLANENLNIYEQGVPRAIPVISGLTYQSEKYFYYASLPNKEGNYTFVIENTIYLAEGEEKSVPIIKNFTIKKTNFTSLAVNPGFVVTREDFSIKVNSPFKNQKIVAILEATNQSKTLNLIESVEETIDFSIANLNSGRTNIRVGEYIIPVFISKEIIPPQNQKLVFSPSEIIATVTPGQNYFFKIFIENYGDTNLTDIRFTSNLNAVIKPETIDLKRGERKIINLTIPISENAKKNVSGKITVNYNDKSLDFNVFFNITQNQSQVNLNGTTVTPGLSCTGKGKLCVYPELCTTQTTNSLEGPCCLGDCIEKAPPADYGWVFGLVLLALLAVLAFFLVKRARQRQKLKSPEEIFDEKSKRFDERMNPPTRPSEEVSGKLGRI